MRFFVAGYLIYLIMSVTFFAILMPLPAAYAQKCQPDISSTSSPGATPQPATTSVVINEVLMLPVHTHLNCDTSPSATSDPPPGPWIELYNTLPYPYSLIHATLDDGNSFPIVASTIPAHGFIVVFPDANLHFMETFNTTLSLVINSTSQDKVTSIPPLPQDTSYARVTDGSSSWKSTPNPTLGISNNVTLATATAHTQKTTTSKTKSKTPKLVATTYVSNSQAAQTQSSAPSSSPQLSTAKAKVMPIQPNWKVVRLPTHVATSTSPEPTTPDLPATIAPITSSPDTLKKIVLSLLTIALASTLWWCRKLFIKV